MSMEFFGVGGVLVLADPLTASFTSPSALTETFILTFYDDPFPVFSQSSPTLLDVMIQLSRVEPWLTSQSGLVIPTVRKVCLHGVQPLQTTEGLRMRTEAGLLTRGVDAELPLFPVPTITRIG